MQQFWMYSVHVPLLNKDRPMILCCAQNNAFIIMSMNAVMSPFKSTFMSFMQFFSVCIYGGGSRKDQINIVQKGVEIVIGEC